MIVCAIFLIIIVVLYIVMYIEKHNKKIEDLNIDDEDEQNIKNIIVPDKVDVNDSTLKSTQDEEAKKYTINMNDKNGVIEKNIIRNNEVIKEVENNVEFNEFVEKAKDVVTDEDPIKDPVKEKINSVKKLFKKDEE